MEKIESLKGKSVAIVGMGKSWFDYNLAKSHGVHFDEVWVINGVGSVIYHDRVFMMDPASRFLDTDDAGGQTESMKKMLQEHPGPIYTCELDERVPALVEYPLEEVIKDQRCAYMNTTVAFSLAFALWSEVDHIDLFGMDFSYKHNLHFAEAGRACLEFWICKCISSGITVGVSPRSSLLDQNVEIENRLYGYHRLANPKIAMPDPQGEWVVCDRSDLAEMVKKHNLETVELPSAPEPYKG